MSSQIASLETSPSCFVVVAGAPRSGTTAISKYLAGHPDVCFALDKEPHFFALHDFENTGALRSAVENYYIPRFFGHCAAEAKIWGEGSVSYLYTPYAAQRLLQIWPAARFILSFRNPLELLPSLHERLFYLGDETVQDFREAWRLTAVRARGEAIPRSCIDPRVLRYDQVGMLGKHLQRFLAHFGRSRCFLILYDDLVERPQKVIHGLLKFLELPHDGRLVLPRAREARRWRIGWLQRLLMRPPKALRDVFAERYYDKLATELKSRPRVTEAGIGTIRRMHKRVRRWNTVPSRRAPLAPDLHRELRDTFADDVMLLGRLLHRDLSHWLRVEGEDGTGILTAHDARSLGGRYS